VNVRLSEESGEFVLEVQDNGRRISEKEIQDAKSIGWLGMSQRAALLGGEVQFYGQPGKGTTVNVRIPRPRTNSGRETLNFHENSSHRRSRLGPARLETHSR